MKIGWINQNEDRFKTRTLDTILLVWQNLPPLKENVSSLELREIRLILITYSCNPPVNPILVCIGTFGQYKPHFYCSPHLFCIWTLKTLLYKFTSYVKPSVIKQIFCLPEQSAKLSQLGLHWQVPDSSQYPCLLQSSSVEQE